MKSRRYHPLNAAHAKRRLALWLTAFAIALMLPVALLLLHVHRQLKNEVFFQYQAASAELANRVNERVYNILKPEAERPFDQYSFWSVPQNALVPEETLNVSPLAQLALQTSVPGAIGYFQIDPDGSFHSPVLPEAEFEQIGTINSLSPPELDQRRALKTRLKGLLEDNPATTAESATKLDAAGSDELTKPQTRLDSKDQDKLRKAKSPDKKERNLDKQFKQQPTAAAYSSDKVTGKTIEELKLNETLYRRQQALPAPSAEWGYRGRETPNKALSQAPRKETLSYLDERKRDSVAVSAQPSASIAEPESQSSGRKRGKLEAAKRSTAPDAAKKPEVRLPGKVEKFEGEIYPIEFDILPAGDFSFFRKVWRDRQRYIQGFVANRLEFLHEVFQSAYLGSVLRDRAALSISHHGKLLQSYGLTLDEGNILIFRTPLAFPLSDMEIVISTADLPLGTGSRLINAIAVFLGLLIPAALYGLYRLGAGQIDLAQQRSNFVSAVSHELRTPLTSIRMYGEILRSGWIESEEKRKSYYEYIFFESERLSRLITNVLQLARLTNNDAPLNLGQYQPERIIDLVRSSLSSQVEAAGFTLDIHAEPVPDSLCILAEEDALCRIFINLVDNALKFSRDADKRIVDIGYRLERGDDSQIIFFVRDYGPGIDKSCRKKLFELFYRGEDELTRATPGTGIGLALVQELAAKLNAKIDFENKLPGVEFTIRFKTMDK